MKRPGKISISFFLNQNVKPVTSDPILGNIETYPLYIQVTYNRRNTQFRSFYKNAYTSIEEAYEHDKDKIEYEGQLIRRVVEYELKCKKDKFQLKGIKDRYMDYTFEVSYYVDTYLRNTLYHGLAKTGSKFWKIMDPIDRDNIPIENYYEASKQLIPDLDSYLSKDYYQELKLGQDFIDWCKKQKNIPMLIDWVDGSIAKSYSKFLKKHGSDNNQIDNSIIFVGNVIRLIEGIDIA